MRGRVSDVSGRWRAAVVAVLVCLASPIAVAGPAALPVGACTACHGDQMQGLQSTGAPRLAGQSAAYIERQLANFRSGIRGTGANDMNGQMMRGVALSLPPNVSLAGLARAVTVFQPLPTTPTISGNAQAGRRGYERCAQCHGEYGEGRADRHAPRLVGMSDWYLRAQFEAFRSGLRGTGARDVNGSEMRSAILAMKGGAQIDDILAYLDTHHQHTGSAP